MQQQRYNLESGDEVELPLEPDVAATNLPGSFEGDFDLDSDASAAFLDQFNTEKETEDVPAISSTTKQDIPDRIAYLVAAGPPVLNMPSAPVEEEPEEAVSEAEEPGDLIEDLKDRTLDESSLVVGDDDDLVEEEEAEEAPPVVMNVGLTRYIVLSTTVMTVAALVPLFLPA